MKKLTACILAVFCFIACSDKMEEEIPASGKEITVRTDISSRSRAGYEGSEVLPSHFYMDIIQGGNGRWDYSLVKMTKEETGNLYKAPTDKLLLWADSENHGNASIKALTLPYGLSEIEPEKPMQISVCTNQTLLYAEGHVFALARFWEQEAFVCVISTEDRDRTIRLPLGAVGAVRPCGEKDLFDRPLVFHDCDSHSVLMDVKAHQSYFFRCDIL